MHKASKIHTNGISSGAVSGGVSAVFHTIGKAARTVIAWQERADQRRQLRALSEYMLKDIGLSRADVEREVSKPFWRA